MQQLIRSNIFYFYVLLFVCCSSKNNNETYYFNMYNIDSGTFIKKDASKIMYSSSTESNWREVSFDELGMVETYKQKILPTGEYRKYNSNSETLYFSFKDSVEHQTDFSKLPVFTKCIKHKTILVNSQKIYIMIFDEYRNLTDWGRQIIYAKDYGIIGYISFTRNTLFLFDKVEGNNVYQKNTIIKKTLDVVKTDSELYPPYAMKDAMKKVIKED